MLISLSILLLIIILSLYTFAPHPPATPKQAANITELETYLNQLVASGNPPGLSAVVVKDGEVVYNKAFGFADGPRNIKATPDTVYHWWSMTKIPTAFAIMQLQEQGNLNLDDEVRKHLPWFEVNYPSNTSPAITIRNLLQHTSGLPDPIPAMIGWVHYNDETFNQTDVLKKYLPEFNTLKFEPGTKAVYGNLNYMVLGAVIEAVSGQSYETYITENILQPLGMSQTSFVYSPAMAEHEAAGTLPVVHYFTPLLPTLLDTNTLIRERDGKMLWMNRVYIDATPSTGLIGSAPDVAKLMLAYLNRVTPNGQLILLPESISTLTNTAPLDGRGLGWAVGESNGKRYLEHGGGGPGFAAIMRLYPDDRLGIAILSNGTDLDRDGLADLIKSLKW
ncbi:serine hydrolase domain-containing protein [Candidatus Villigracilis affinis]|uniref:serine hydrolase domain-containing protein n=1 Tax=Candidatus Villigracilis affinis TaxID=3140682 RepID=UPI001DAAFE0E|nr:beta-lactamase family protein [Anaerolineales bacterium]